MRNVSKVLVVAAMALTLGGCVNNEQPSTEPTGDTPSVQNDASEDVSTAVECTAEDIAVTGAAAEHPVITVPDTCSAPTQLIVADLAPGTGPEAVEGSAMQANYALTAWSSGQEIETSYPPSGQGPLPIDSVGSGLIEAWNQGLVGMRQGGRRLIVAPPELAYGGSGNELENETLVFVIDAVQVTPA